MLLCQGLIGVSLEIVAAAAAIDTPQTGVKNLFDDDRAPFATLLRAKPLAKCATGSPCLASLTSSITPWACHQA
jgi:hypothetical protein